jgi:hypothetical protein
MADIFGFNPSKGFNLPRPARKKFIQAGLPRNFKKYFPIHILWACPEVLDFVLKIYSLNDRNDRG